MMKKIINNLNNKELGVIIKYLFSSGTSFLIDIILFSVFNLFITNHIYFSVVISTILARILSSFYNYFVNSRYVFKKWSKVSIIKYYVLVITQMIISAFTVQLLNNYLNEINATILKVFVDIIIFVINFIIQRMVIFK